MAKFCWVVEKWTIMCGEVVLGGKWSGGGLAFNHGVAMKKIQRLFDLRDVEFGILWKNFSAKKVTHGAQVLDIKGRNKIIMFASKNK
ncbi:hypothetical protein Pyn_01380 [Prunus yedoensis var. nudiflora]|uniref:Uncharacterized protein n=1 Tax=Prunus yedoensis var. nudiflora TaxID=2094558 RepID=A0A314V2M6_PRUYE|nr:hypothetical protein Pyn_01380 [Prunus yedoensis var. nudiflora]